MNQVHQLCTENASKLAATTRAPRRSESAVAINSIKSFVRYSIINLKLKIKKQNIQAKKKHSKIAFKNKTNTYSQETKIRIHTLHILNYYFFSLYVLWLKKRRRNKWKKERKPNSLWTEWTNEWITAVDFSAEHSKKIRLIRYFDIFRIPNAEKQRKFVLDNFRSCFFSNHLNLLFVPFRISYHSVFPICGREFLLHFLIFVSFRFVGLRKSHTSLSFVRMVLSITPHKKEESHKETHTHSYDYNINNINTRPNEVGNNIRKIENKQFSKTFPQPIISKTTTP